MARPREHIRVDTLPDGTLKLLPKKSKLGKEVHGLSRNATTGAYYSLQDGSRKYWGTDLNRAVAAYERSIGKPPRIR